MHSGLMNPGSCLLGDRGAHSYMWALGRDQGGQLPENVPTSLLPAHSLPPSLTRALRKDRFPEISLHRMVLEPPASDLKGPADTCMFPPGVLSLLKTRPESVLESISSVL